MYICLYGWDRMSAKVLLTSRDFQKVALQRLNTAQFLAENGYNLDAMYLAGYAVECSLKALILERTPAADQEKKFREISSGRQMHDLENLAALLKAVACPVPIDLVKRFRRSGWSTDLRYEHGRTDTGETRGFLRTAQMTYDWVKGLSP
jgi:HEPN domain-containing protein